MKTDNSRNDDVSIKLATYMERLDNYIQTQTNLNESICKNLENIEEELAEVYSWRNKIYGMRTGIVALGILVLHTSAVMGSFAAMLHWWDN